MKYYLKIRWRGFSLIELMIALSLGLLVVGIMMEIVLSCQQLYRFNINLARLQENARAATIILSKSMRDAGYIGCGHSDIEFPLRDHLANSSLWPMIKIIPNFDDEGNDAIQINKALEPAAYLWSLNRSEQEMRVTDQIQFHENDTILLSNCFQGDIIKINSIDAIKNSQLKLISFSAHLTRSYPKYSEIRVWSSGRYYIADTKRKNSSGESIIALYGPEGELIENVIAMHAKLIASKRSAHTIKINLLLTSADEILSHPQAYDFEGQKMMPHDRHLYRELDIMVVMRE